MVNARNESWKSNDEGGAKHCQDPDNADSPTDDSVVDDDDDDGCKKRKRKQGEKYPKYLSPAVDRVNLYVGMKFRDKTQLKEAINNYKIVKGYNLKITKSDTTIFQCHCLG